MNPIKVEPGDDVIAYPILLPIKFLRQLVEECKDKGENTVVMVGTTEKNPRIVYQVVETYNGSEE